MKNAQQKKDYTIEDEDLKRIFFSGPSRDEDLKIKERISKYKQTEEGSKCWEEVAMHSSAVFFTTNINQSVRLKKQTWNLSAIKN